MITYATWSLTNSLNSVPWFSSTTNYLTYFYQMPGDRVSWIGQVVGIQENWVSIFITVLLVVMLFALLLNFTTTNHN